MSEVYRSKQIFLINNYYVHDNRDNNFHAKDGVHEGADMHACHLGDCRHSSRYRIHFPRSHLQENEAKCLANVAKIVLYNN